MRVAVRWPLAKVLSLVWVLLLLQPGTAHSGESKWKLLLAPVGVPLITSAGMGCRDSALDGYDAYDKFLYGIDWSIYKGAGVTFSRDPLEGWDGPKGMYGNDFRSSIPPSAEKTWAGLCIWANGVLIPDNIVSYAIWPELPVPEVARARLVLDYVPPHLGYTGPTDFDLDLHYTLVPLPVPNVTDPLQGTRMHITVTMVPEPTSLLALSAGLAGMAGAMRRRAGGRPRHERRGEG